MITKECKQCGKQFTISDSEINFYKSRNLSIPKRCKECRRSNKKGNDGYYVDNVDERIEKTVNRIKSSPVSNYKISTSGNGKKYIQTAIACCTVAIVVICTTAALLLTKSNDTNDPDTQADNIHTEAENSEITENYVQDDKEYTHKNDSNDEMSVDFTFDSQQQIGFTEVPGGNDYDDQDAVVLKFRNEDLLESHFQKHGKDMGFESADEYELAAGDVINSSAALHKTEKEDGDDIYYIESSNDLVIVSTDGYIRTYFRPDSGKNYYDKQ